ncbi:MAG TPA: right-handed parallel beta-helix repeat-containing protein [Gaiellales bacterium]|jgi:parallel beta-helix repeat protein|nr:right-handed parallel beta-helix repeat-containing protein [Gaiellales bacterium]
MVIGRAHLLALAAGACLCLSAATAGAKTGALDCGSTLTKSTTLSADIQHCPGTALIVGADGITIDLGGHTISGTNATGSEGIANDGHAGVHIVGGGKITDFRLNGVGMRKAPKSVVRGLTIRRIGAGGVEGEPVSAGIAIVDSPGSQVIGNDVANDVEAYQADGADVLNSRGSVVRGNSLSHNSWNGLVLIESPGSRITGNQLDANGNNGTEVNGGSDAVTVARNSADDNKAIGIVVGVARNVRVVGNTARRNDTGLFFFDLHASVISRNSATANRAGLELAGGQSGSDGNQLTGNIANRNGETGIGVVDGANANVVSGNTANGNLGTNGGGGGINVRAGSGNQLSGNVANANLDTGILIAEDEPGDTTGNSLKNNTANKNRGHGIDAIAGSVDGGGNRASGNVTSPQCQNINCAG